MGSEHSSQQKQAQKIPPIQRGHTIAAAGQGSESGNNSPGTSVCSDSELPYISYTLGRPIGDSPKNTKSATQKSNDKKNVQPKRRLSLQTRKTKKAHDIVVVKEAKSVPDMSDEALKRLENIPTFLPIMRGSLSFSNVKDPVVVEGLDYKPLYRLASRYQAHLAACAQPLAAEQQTLTAKLKEMEIEVPRIYGQMVERQRSNARHAERLARVRELNHQLSLCHSLLRQNLLGIEELNQLLPAEHKLEPFVWKSNQDSAPNRQKCPDR